MLLCTGVLAALVLPSMLIEISSPVVVSAAIASATLIGVGALSTIASHRSPSGRAPSAGPDDVRPDDPSHRAALAESTRSSIVLAVLVVGTVAALLAGGPGPTWLGVDPALVESITATVVVAAFTCRVAAAALDHDRTRSILIRQITHDDLTRLPNRVGFVESVAEQLERTWDTEQRTTIALINLDRFKNINDTFGHHVANEVLVVVADRLREAAPTGAMVARVGGDDFAVLQSTARTTDEVLEVAETLRAELERPISIEGSNVFLTASIGVALAPRLRTTAPEELVRRADIAAHHAKRNGRNRVEVFDESMHDRLTRRMDVEHALHGAIGRREMRLHHQPIIDIVTGEVSGFEALMRWERNEGVFVSPADFIPVAEETGIIRELGAWAIREALGDLHHWITDGLVPARATMSVNVSPRQVSDPAFADVVRTAIDQSGAPPELLWLEITESMMLDEPEHVAGALDEIRRMGVRIALDDFGTGFSSLSVLQQFPIERIKIDRSFVTGLGCSADQSTNEGSLVRTIIAMAGAMSLDLVAEGVETISQLEHLRRFGCSKAQGFLISRPVPAAAMRSTMVALDELSALPLFREDAPARPDIQPAPTPTRPARTLASSIPGPGRPIAGPSISLFPTF